MKKLFALLLAIVMVASLCACSGGANTAKVVEINLTEEQYAFGVDKDQEDQR